MHRHHRLTDLFVLTALLLTLPILLLACAGESPTGKAEPATAVGPQLENGSFTATLGTDPNGFEIHYEVHGSGPVLMTLPNSWGLSLEGLRSLFKPLEQHLTLVYFDPRGMGESAEVREETDRGTDAVRADFHALRVHLGLDRVHAIGWSNGATNLIRLASERPETLRSAIFVHTTPSFTEEDGAAMQERLGDLLAAWAGLQQKLADDSVPDAEKEESLRRLYIDEWFPYLFADREMGRQRTPEIFGDAEFSWRHGLYANQEAPTYDLTDRLAQITVPSLVIAGAHDLLPAERTRELHEGIEGSRFVVFENSGHFAMSEEPDKWLRVVLDFVEAVEARSSGREDPGHQT